MRGCIVEAVEEIMDRCDKRSPDYEAAAHKDVNAFSESVNDSNNTSSHV